MTSTPIDLRSDTVTKPTLEMRAAMARAEVGDDVFDEDPTVHILQDRVAQLLGKEAALFVPSGTMANQICIRAHTCPGDELLCETTSHVYVWEAGGPAALSGVTTRPVDGDFGVLDVQQLQNLIRPANEHYTRSRLVVLENTHNRGGGRIFPLEKIQAISTWAHANGLSMHLDGARIWNASVASGIALEAWCQPFDSVAVCFSKGLGAPIGSAVVGTRDFVAKARRIRKLFGGHMRQVGILAAGAIHALDHHVSRLADDHRHAKILAQAIQDSPGLRLDPPFVETNLVWFEVDPALASAPIFANRLREKGILVHPAGPTTLRACTHLDVSIEQTAYAADMIRTISHHSHW
ncbi:MAG: aminotransferase class I/II-fold pyridoxal phosphate-dependent enzyme [Gemmataceae bacterium]|nr:aminotransferase class I/II-fold pyridoxal phosphate-dependent enzyme [Gemmataceae bacterium]